MDFVTVFFKMILFEYHQSIKSALLIFGVMLFIISLKMGFVKH